MANYELNEDREILRDGKVCGEVEPDGHVIVMRGYERFRPEIEAAVQEHRDLEDSIDEFVERHESGTLPAPSTGRPEVRQEPDSPKRKRITVLDKATGQLKAHIEPDRSIVIPLSAEPNFRQAVEDMLQIEPPPPEKGDPEPPNNPHLGDKCPRTIAWRRVNWSPEQFNATYQRLLPRDQLAGVNEEVSA